MELKQCDCNDGVAMVQGTFEGVTYTYPITCDICGGKGHYYDVSTEDDHDINHALKVCMDDLQSLADRCLHNDLVDVEEYECIMENLRVYRRLHLAATQDGGGEGDDHD